MGIEFVVGGLGTESSDKKTDSRNGAGKPVVVPYDPTPSTLTLE